MMILLLNSLIKIGSILYSVNHYTMCSQGITSCYIFKYSSLNLFHGVTLLPHNFSPVFLTFTKQPYVKQTLNRQISL